MAYEDPALSAYRQVDVKTASQGELILLLYDEGIKQLGCAIELMDVQKIPASDIERVHRHILKAQEIITELSVSLDMEAGEKIAQNLLSIYAYFNQQLFHANIQKRADELVTVRDMMRQLREAWFQIVKSPASSVTSASPASYNVNLAG